MCEMATVSRASFYRHWEKKAPTEAEMALRDVIQRMARLAIVSMGTAASRYWCNAKDMRRAPRKCAAG